VPVQRELQVEVEYSNTYEGCFVCGKENTRGMCLEFFWDGEKQEANTSWRPERYMQGYENVVHGGFITMVLDEVMAKVCLFTGAPAVTARMEVKFVRPVYVNEELEVHGRCIEIRGKRLKLEASCTGGGGEEKAKAQALFLAV
jgi:acyl-coenzyme A thioesterase PaaI-like protein